MKFPAQVWGDLHTDPGVDVSIWKDTGSQALGVGNLLREAGASTLEAVERIHTLQAEAVTLSKQASEVDRRLEEEMKRADGAEYREGVAREERDAARVACRKAEKLAASRLTRLQAKAKRRRRRL